MKLTKLAVSIFAALAISTSIFADEAYDVMKKFTTLPVPDFTQSQMLMDVIEKDGSVEHREMLQYGRGFNGLKDTVFDLRSPASVKDTRVLQSEKTAKEDDRWIYLPQLRTTRRIPAGERYKSFVGCEFTYNDMTIRHVDADTHEMLNTDETVTVDGGKYGKTTYKAWKIKSVPVKKSDVEYSYRISWIDKDTYLPVRMEYYDKKDPTKVMKTLVIEKIEHVKGQTGKEYVLRRSCLVQNNITGRATRVYVGNFVWDKEVPASLFTQNWLTTGKK